MKAVVDIGTNSVLLLLGRRDVRGKVAVVRDEARVTRLGEGVAARGRLDPAAVERTVRVLAEYRALAEEAGAKLQAVATEGLRLAQDRDDFLERASDLLGVPVRMISGDEEARLSYLSVAREKKEAAPLRVLDIGGGSTELAAGFGEQCEETRSHPIGSVRLTERFVDSDPPSPEAIQNIEQAAAEAFATQPVTPHEELHGLAGTVTTAAALMLELQRYHRDAVDGTRFTRDQVTALRDTLASEPLATRSQRPCLPKGRADVIVAGLCILKVAMEHCGAQTLVVRDRGLRYALL